MSASQKKTLHCSVCLLLLLLLQKKADYVSMELQLLAAPWVWLLLFHQVLITQTYSSWSSWLKKSCGEKTCSKFLSEMLSSKSKRSVNIFYNFMIYLHINLSGKNNLPTIYNKQKNENSCPLSQWLKQLTATSSIYSVMIMVIQTESATVNI
jgi:hypothetical protein